MSDDRRTETTADETYERICEHVLGAKGTRPISEIEQVRASAQEWARVAEHWMNEHDRLLAFIQADPDRLAALHEWKPV